jgi:translocator protein
MSAHTQIRLASLATAAYGAFLASGVVHHFQRTGSLRALVSALWQPAFWVAMLVVVVVTVGLWNRQAWAWWLGIAAACFQIFRIVSAYVQGRSFGQVPAFSTLLALGLLLLIVVLLLPRNARLGCNR